jgi:indoleamine 2,3-dioxygenase
MPEDTPRPIVIPRALAVPLVGVSRALGIAPVLCYADTVLWNWELIDDTEPISSENIRPRYLFSGTEDEAGFYISCARVEFVGIELLRLIENFKHIRDPESPLGICTMHQDLVKLKQVIADLSEAIQVGGVNLVCRMHIH